jgi:hypothetical protein
MNADVRMPYIVPDTNFFLQCHPIDALDWSLVTDAQEFVLAVPRMVQREIDKHKGSGNNRRASRARKVASLFRKILDADPDGYSINGRGVKINICLRSSKLNADDFPDLDLDEPDERIVAETALLSRQNPSEDVTLITDDTPIMATAKALGVAYRSLPDEWFLPPEPDAKDKEIAELKRRLLALEQDAPVLEFAHEGGADEFEVTHYEPLNDQAIDELVRHAQALAPMRVDFSAGGSTPAIEGGSLAAHFASRASLVARGMDLPPHQHEIDRYQNIEYPKWIRDLRSQLKSMHSWLNHTQIPAISVTLSNAGSKPATGLLVEVDLLGDLYFDDNNQVAEGDDASAAPLPSPPAPPKMRSMFDSISIASGLSRQLSDYASRDWSLGVMRHIGPKDPHAFYRDSSRETAQSRAYTCEKFRHRHDAETFNLSIVPFFFDKDAYSGAMVVKAHATNLPVSVEKTVTLRFAIKHGDTAAEIRRLLEECIHKYGKEHGLR